MNGDWSCNEKPNSKQKIHKRNDLVSKIPKESRKRRGSEESEIVICHY